MLLKLIIVPRSILYLFAIVERLSPLTILCSRILKPFKRDRSTLPKAFVSVTSSLLKTASIIESILLSRGRFISTGGTNADEEILAVIIIPKISAAVNVLTKTFPRGKCLTILLILFLKLLLPEDFIK